MGSRTVHLSAAHVATLAGALRRVPKSALDAKVEELARKLDEARVESHEAEVQLPQATSVLHSLRILHEASGLSTEEAKLTRAIADQLRRFAAQEWVDEMRQRGAVWTVEDDEGIPAPVARGHSRRAMPFWSSEARVHSVIEDVPAYGSFRPRRVTYESFREHWLPELERDGLLVGINWVGTHAAGYDWEPAELLSVLLPPAPE